MNFLVLILLIANFTLLSEPMHIELSAKKQKKMNLLVGVIDPDPTLKEVAHTLQTDLACPLQNRAGFSVQAQQFKTIPSKKALKELHKKGYPTVLFISRLGQDEVAWRMYDAYGAQMIAGKSLPLDDKGIITGHMIADKAWQLLTGQEGIFSTLLAYCQEKDVKKTYCKDLCVQHPFDGRRHHLVQNGKPLAPRWNKDSKHPRLLYSEATPSNIRLMSVTLDGSRSVVSNFDGLNMLPSFASDGNRVVYCFTNDGKSQLFYYEVDDATNKGVMKRLTHNNGNNLSPCLLDNGDVLFSSDFAYKAPQIYHYHRGSNSVERITAGGFSACPAYCSKTDRLAYCKIIKGVTQIFVCDMKTKQHVQVTYDGARKDECCWSPCGNYVAYAYETNKARRVAVLNMVTREQFFVTPSSLHCTYPAWSPKYEAIVTV